MPVLPKLHRAVGAGAYTSWPQWYPSFLGQRLDCTASGAICPIRVSSTADALCVRASALQCCSGVAAGHTGLLSVSHGLPDATLASATLQPLSRCHLSACPGPCNRNLPCTGTHFTCHPCPGLEVELGLPWTFSASGVRVAV